MPSNTTAAVGLAEAHRRLAELDRAVDATRVALAQLRACLPPPTVPDPRHGVVEIPDTPYDPAMWQGAEDEGIGGHHP